VRAFLSVGAGAGVEGGMVLLWVGITDYAGFY
jgi:hypothetical protein